MGTCRVRKMVCFWQMLHPNMDFDSIWCPDRFPVNPRSDSEFRFTAGNVSNLSAIEPVGLHSPTHVCKFIKTIQVVCSFADMSRKLRKTIPWILVRFSGRQSHSWVVQGETQTFQVVQSLWGTPSWWMLIVDDERWWSWMKNQWNLSTFCWWICWEDLRCSYEW